MLKKSRPLFIALLFAACSTSRPPAKAPETAPLPDTLPDDPDVLAACQPDDPPPPPIDWQKDEKGQTVLKNDGPGYGQIAQIIGYEKENEAGPSIGKTTAIVNLATLVIENDKASPAARVIARWHRAMAHHDLGHWREAWLDFGAVVKAGPDSPFYKWLGSWLNDLAPKFSYQAYSACLSAYERSLPQPSN